MEYSSNAKGNLGVTLGAIGTGLGILGGTSLLGGITPMGNQYVGREAFDLSMKLSASERDNAILTAELASEKKMVEVFNSLNDKLQAYKTEQSAINAAQAVTNTAVTSNIAVMQNNINQLMGMTKLVIPYKNVCPIPAIANPQPTDD